MVRLEITRPISPNVKNVDIFPRHGSCLEVTFRWYLVSVIRGDSPMN